MIAALLVIAVLVVTFVVGPLLIARAASHAEGDDHPVPTDVIDEARAAFHERKAS